MRDTTIRWTFYMACVLAIGPLAAALAGSIRGPEGGLDATGLVSSSPVAGMAFILAAMGIAGLAGCACALLCGVRPGMISAGLVLAWVAWRTGTVDGLLRSAGNAAPLSRLAIEGVMVGAATVAMVAAMLVVARPEPEPARQEGSGRSPEAARRLGVSARWKALVKSVTGAKGAATGSAAALGAFGGVAWLVAVEPLKGQVIAAAAAGAAAGTVVLRLMCHTGSPVLVAACGAVLMVAGPLTPGVLGQTGSAMKLLDAVNRNDLFTLGHLTPLDWSAGLMLGIAWSWGIVGGPHEKRAGVTG